MGTMGTINDTQSHTRKIFTTLAIAALLGAHLISLGALPASADSSPSKWEINRVILKLDNGETADSNEADTFFHKAGSDYYLWHDGDPRAEVHLSCSDDLVGAQVLDKDGEELVKVDEFYLDLVNPQGHEAGCPIGDPNLIPEPQLSVGVDKTNAAGGNDYDNENQAGEPNEAVPFRVEITNEGNISGEITDFTDVWPQGDDPDDEWDFLGDDADQISCTLGGEEFTLDTPIPGGATIICDFTVDGYAPNAGDELINEVSVTLSDTADDELADPATGTDTSKVTTPSPTTSPPPADPDADISLVKLVDGDGEIELIDPEADDEVTYTFTITNEDEDDLIEIVLSDVIYDVLADLGDGLAVGFVGDIARTIDVDGTEGIILEPGEDLELEITYALTDEDIERGGIYNVATVEAIGDGSGDEVSASDDALVTITTTEPEPDAVLDDVDEIDDPVPAEDPGPQEVEVRAEVEEQPDEDVEVAAEVQEQLPRTGVDSDTLLLLGLLLTILGATAVLLAPQRRFDVA